MTQSLAAVRAHHDQVGIETARGIEHSLGWIAAYNERFVAHCCRNLFARELHQMLAGCPFQGRGKDPVGTGWKPAAPAGTGATFSR